MATDRTTKGGNRRSSRTRRVPERPTYTQTSESEKEEQDEELATRRDSYRGKEPLSASTAAEPQQQQTPPPTHTVPEVVIPKGRAQCPICGMCVLEALISSHVDVCLQREASRSSSKGVGNSNGGSPFTFGRPSEVSKLPNKLEPKRLPKLVYHIIKDKELKKYVQRYALPTAGDRKVRKEGHGLEIHR